MTSTRWATILSFAVGTSGLALAVTTESVLLGVAGSGIFLASAIALVRHLWRQGEMRRRRSTYPPQLATSLAEIRQHADQLEAAVDSGFQLATNRIDAFARGVFEYLAQIQLDLTSQQKEVLGLNKQVEEDWHKAVSQLAGVVGVYATLKPRLPYPPFGGFAIAGDSARRLVEVIMVRAPEWIIEVGSGLSTLLAAQALDTMGGKGQILALEHEEYWLQRSLDLLEQHEVLHRAHIAHAPLVDVTLGGEVFRWYDLSDVTLPTNVEILFVDGPPLSTGRMARYPALPLLLNHLAESGVILMDDAARPDEKAVIERWANERPELDVFLHPDSRGTAEIRRVEV